MIQYVFLLCIITFYSVHVFTGENTKRISSFVLHQRQFINFKEARKEAILLEKFLNHDQEN